MIPLKIETLLAGRVVEQNRVEYKEGWNPGDIIHSICAFANDYHNMNGGYLVIGVKANDGIQSFLRKDYRWIHWIPYSRKYSSIVIR